MSAITESAAEVRDRAIAENHALRQENAELRGVLNALVAEPVRYSSATIEIDCADHADAMSLVRRARTILARTP